LEVSQVICSSMWFGFVIIVQTVDQADDLPISQIKLPVKCWGCKWLYHRKCLCKKKMYRSFSVLIEEHSTSDDPATICNKIIKSMYVGLYYVFGNDNRIKNKVVW
uniref:Uncharacterized protein n=1 Tax=Pygocentrus nattereri TaxID=42514 RepID=A0AAR2K720_PYGNA